MDRKIDVIVPMYNSEKYIDNLIQCLEMQTMKDYCAIFVDDGSVDNTYNVLQEKLKLVSFKYEIIHQENKGLSGARNTGIQNSKADWLVFIDSDDGIDSHYLEFLYKGVAESKTKIAFSKYQTITCEDDIVQLKAEEFHVRKISACECLKEYYTKWFGVWVGIVNRAWLEEIGLLFDEKCTYLEDVPFITQVIAHSDSVAMVDNSIYLYYQRQGSLMNTPKIEKYIIAMNGFEAMRENLKLLQNEAVDEFFSMGQARYYLATLRKGAVLMPFDKFIELCEYVPLKTVKQQLIKLVLKQRLAGYLFLVSKRLFYIAMRFVSPE